MAKKNGSNALNETPTPTAVAEVAASNDGPAEIVTLDGIAHDLSALSDKSLAALSKAVGAEFAVRREAQKRLMPKLGSTVQITSGKWSPKVGTVVEVRKTRLYVQIEGFPVPAYVLASEVTIVEG